MNKSTSKGRLKAMFGLTFAVLGVIYLLNASWLADEPDGHAELLAHRGIHQLYDRKGIDKDTCTAGRMLPSTNPYLENTIASMDASFAAGADILEIDVHPTTDNDFAVFHDWTIDCRTEAKGVTREQSMAYLKSLDVGWGYTSDNGKTYPFRGKGKGMMPSLAEVLNAFPDKRFLINIKSRWKQEADLLLAYLQRHEVDIDRRVMVYGGERPIERWKEIHPSGFAFSKSDMKRCTLAYAAIGWSTIVPDSCKNGVIGVPVGFRNLVWGWPNRFLQRMKAAGTTTIIFGEVENDNGAPGITDPADLAAIPNGFGGLIWIDAIETVGPAWTASSAARSPRIGAKRR
jgi:glycerophosphoryl diester phosphodiesterase